MVSLNAKPDWLWIQFVDHNAITAWASHSGLVVDGDKPHISIPEEIRWEMEPARNRSAIWANQLRSCEKCRETGPHR